MSVTDDESDSPDDSPLLTFVVGEEEEKITIRQSMVTNISAFFDVLISMNNLSISSTESKIVLDHVEVETFQYFVRFLECKDTTLLTSHVPVFGPSPWENDGYLMNLGKLMILADMYGIKKLEEYCGFLFQTSCFQFGRHSDLKVVEDGLEVAVYIWDHTMPRHQARQDLIKALKLHKARIYKTIVSPEWYDRPESTEAERERKDKYDDILDAYLDMIMEF